MKIRFKVLATLILLLIGSPLTFMFFTIANSTDCNQLVIDTYELHSGIDIPDVDVINCYYDEISKVRISVYELTSNIDFNKFTFISSAEDNLLDGKYLLSESELPSTEEFYVATGESWGNRWTYLVDPKTNRLWAELRY